MKMPRFARRLISLLLVTFMMVPVFTSCEQKNTVTVDVPDAVRDQSLTLTKDLYDASEAALTNASLAFSRDDFSGTGYVDEMQSGAAVSFSVEALKTGTYGVRVRYTNVDGSEKSLDIYVNGEFVSTEVFKITPNETTWLNKLIPVGLAEGGNTFELRCTSTENAGICVDRIDVSRLYQAEEAAFGNGAMALKAYKGYTGGGYVGLYSQDHVIRFDVDAEASCSYELTFRYVAPQTDSNGRSVTLTVNDTYQEQIWLTSGRSTANWLEYRHTVDLKEGANTIYLNVGKNDSAQISLDCITLKPTNWTYAGKVERVEGSGTPQLDFVLDNCVIRVNSVDLNSLKVWLDPDGRFIRKYESEAVANEAVNPQKLYINETEKFYYFETGVLHVRVYKDPCRIVYIDKTKNEIITYNDAYSLGWSTDDELICRSVIGENEHFWGLGETPVSFDRLGTKTAFWGNDIVAVRADSAVPNDKTEPRWYMNNPVFISSKGYAMLFDNPSRTVFDFGKDDPDTYYFASLNPYPAGELIYYFIYNGGVKGTVTGLSNVIGRSFFAPLYAYGNMQSHWGYKQADMERVAKEYRDKEIPLDIIIADIEWYEHFCDPTDWNDAHFPDPDAMVDYLNSLHVRFGVIDDPNIDKSCASYAEGAEKGCFATDNEGNVSIVCWPWGSSSGLTDFFDPDVRLWWVKLHQNLFDKGISFFWMDMNEPAKYNSDWYFYNVPGKALGTLADCKNIYAINQQKTMFEAMKEHNNGRSIMLTRSGYTGTQRYACPWTGDIYSDYKAMQQQLSLGLGLSMSGYMYWTCDIGGSSGGFSDEEHMRWIELGTFMPITRYHSTSSWEGDREPYAHNSEAVAKKYISLRYQFLPYFYSMSADSIFGIGIEGEEKKGGTGYPLTRPMAFEYPEDENTWGNDTQFICGTGILVAPVLENKLTKDIYLPKGSWYDFNSNTYFKGKQTITYDAPLDVLPVLIKEGSIIPTWDVMQYVGEKAIDKVYIDVYPTMGDGEYSFVYYEDDGVSDGYESGKYALTSLSGKTSGKTHTLKIGARTGEYTDVADRDFIVKFHVLDKKFSKATVNGKAVAAVSGCDELLASESSAYFDAENGIVYVKLHDTASEQTVSVSVK